MKRIAVGFKFSSTGSGKPIKPSSVVEEFRSRLECESHACARGSGKQLFVHVGDVAAFSCVNLAEFMHVDQKTLYTSLTGAVNVGMLARLRDGDPNIPAGRIRQDQAFVVAVQAAMGPLDETLSDKNKLT